MDFCVFCVFSWNLSVSFSIAQPAMMSQKKVEIFLRKFCKYPAKQFLQVADKSPIAKFLFPYQKFLFLLGWEFKSQHDLIKSRHEFIKSHRAFIKSRRDLNKLHCAFIKICRGNNFFQYRLVALRCRNSQVKRTFIFQATLSIKFSILGFMY